MTESKIVTPEGSVEGPKTSERRLSACKDSSLVNGISNHLLRVAERVMLLPNIYEKYDS